MGYFSNSSEGDVYEWNVCRHCVHYGPEGTSCPVLLLHLLWNYEQCESHSHTPEEAKLAETKRTALDNLIPRDERGYNGDCAMFHRHVPTPEEQGQLALPALEATHA